MPLAALRRETSGETPLLLCLSCIRQVPLRGGPLPVPLVSLVQLVAALLLAGSLREEGKESRLEASAPGASVPIPKSAHGEPSPLPFVALVEFVAALPSAGSTEWRNGAFGNTVR